MVLLLGGAAMMAACGGGDGQTETEAQSSSGSPPSDRATTEIEVTMTDFAYTPSDISVPAGETVTLTFTNTGEVEHYFVVGDTVASDQDGFQQNLFGGVSIEKGKQTTEHAEVEHDEDEHGEEEEEHHATEFELPPGGSGSITFTLPPSKAGTYTIACFESTGKQTHYQMGMRGTLTVTAL